MWFRVRQAVLLLFWWVLFGRGGLVRVFLIMHGSRRGGGDREKMQCAESNSSTLILSIRHILIATDQSTNDLYIELHSQSHAQAKMRLRVV